MKRFRLSILMIPLALTTSGALAQVRTKAPTAPSAAQDLSGLHAFDTRVGRWTAHHKVLKERLANSQEWIEYDGTQTCWLTLGGYGNADDNFFDHPSGAFRGVSVRTYDPKTGIWSIWWFNGRKPSSDIDPPVRGRFVNGVGTFLADDTFNDKPITVRYIWSEMTPASAHWEQAFSPDKGRTWETNWITDFRKAP